MKCFIPSKIVKNFEPVSPANSNQLDDNQALLLLRIVKNFCTNTNIKEWFYKLCPFQSTHQQLTYKKKAENGEEYIENWTIGNRQNLTNVTSFDFFKPLFYNSTLKYDSKAKVCVTNDKVTTIFSYFLYSINY